MAEPLIADTFAGGGGASLGIAWALGRAPDVAINHDAAAIAMHEANHPSTKHYHEDVWRVSPRKVTKGRKVGLLWASPDCTHFSRAKGGKPVSKKIRSLAWVIVKWATEVKPALIILENVREFQEWGPLLPLWGCRGCDWKGTEGQVVLARKHRRCPRCESTRLVPQMKRNKRTGQLEPLYVPDPDKKGLTFKQWVGRLKAQGYQVEWRNLDAADYGAPTHRKRLFVVARCDGEPIMWPDPTHADPKKIAKNMPLFGEQLKPYRTAAECIDWDLPCPSIFDRKKPLAEKTLRRIALGLKRYVLDNPHPFIVGVGGPGYSGKPRDVERPMGTLIKENHSAVVTPYVTPVTHDGERRSHGIDEPLPTVTTAQRGEFALISPTLIQTGYGEREGQAPRCLDIHKPLGTVTGDQKHALVAAMMTKFYGGPREVPGFGQTPDQPFGTVTQVDHHGLVGASLVKFRGDSDGQSLDRPMPTITSGAGAARPAGAAHALGLMSAALVGVGGRAGQSPATSPNAPLGTATTKADKAIAACYLARFNHGDKQWNGVDEPLGAITSQGNKFGLVYAFLMKYFGSGGQWGACDKPLGTATVKARFCVVTVEVAPGQLEQAVCIEVPGIGPCIIADIGLRMLTPRELARAQGFPDTYELLGSKSNQVARLGNSVCPAIAKAMVAANYSRVGVAA